MRGEIPFAAPFFNSIDSGIFFKRSFAWLYTLIAILNWLVPIYFVVNLLDNEYLKELIAEDGKLIFAIGLVFIVTLFSAWIGFQLWWHRKGKLKQTSSQGDEFVATPVIVHFFQTIGEWLGLWFFMLGFTFGITSLMTSNYFSEFFGFIGRLSELGISLIVVAPLGAFFIILIFRFLAEQFRALAAIGNNTRLKNQ